MNQHKIFLQKKKKEKSVNLLTLQNSEHHLGIADHGSASEFVV